MMKTYNEKNAENIEEIDWKERIRQYEGEFVRTDSDYNDQFGRIRCFHNFEESGCTVTVEYLDSYLTEEFEFPKDFLLNRISLKDRSFQNDFFRIIGKVLDADETEQQKISKPSKDIVYKSLSHFNNIYSRELQKKIYNAKLKKETRYKLLFGKKQIDKSSQFKFVYLFQLERALKLPENTLIKIWEKNADYEAMVLECSENEILIVTYDDFGDSVDFLEFSSDLTWLTVKEETALTNACNYPNEIVKKLVLSPEQYIDKTSTEIRKGQKTAVQASLNDDIVCVWGPPGTGKTTTLAQMIIEKIMQRKTVLVLSYSNISVDTALNKLIKELDKRNRTILPGSVLRLGNPRLNEIIEHPFLTPTQAMDYLQNNKLYSEILKILEMMEQRKCSDEQTLKKVISELSFMAGFPECKSLIEIKQKVKEQIQKGQDRDYLISEAQVIFTTVASMMTSKNLKRSFDSVFFDEISMATLPQTVIAAQKAQNHLILLGDFNQLPPVEEGILSRDVYRYLGIYKSVTKNYRYKWLVLLDTQYRMGSQIADFLNKHLYNRLLKTPSSVDAQLKKIIDSEPFSGNQIILADCSGMMTNCKILPNYSRMNILSALIAASLGIRAASVNNVAIISPYRVQAQLIQNICSDFRELGVQKNFKTIEASTVHQFQGSESDVVILDLTDCYRAPYLSGLLTKKLDQLADRLLNVSMSRAKGKLIVLMHKEYFDSHLKSKDLLLWKWLNVECLQCVNGKPKVRIVTGKELEEEIRKVSDQETVNKLFFKTGENEEIVFQTFNVANDIPKPDNGLSKKTSRTFKYPTETDRLTLIWNRYEEDLSKAKKSIRIDLPGNIENPSQAYELRDILLKKLGKTRRSSKGKNNAQNIKVIVRSENPEEIPVELRQFVEENRSAIDPITVIDDQTFWYGMPRHLGSFKLKNADPIPANCWPVFRLHGRFVCSSVSGLLEMQETDKGLYRIPNLKEQFEAFILTSDECGCEEHHIPMKLINKNNHEPFLGCPHFPGCTETKNISYELMKKILDKLESKLICPTCGEGELELKQYKTKKGFYFQCSKNSKDNFTLGEIL